MSHYKKWMPSREFRLTLLKYLRWIPDALMLRLQYFIKHRRVLHLSEPRRFSELIQWYKIHSRDPLMTLCADKLAVRAFVESRGLGDTLNGVYAIAGSPQSLKIDDLPERFVIKTNNGSGTNIICSDKSTLSRDEVRRQLTEWLARDNYASAREWAYRDVVPLIFVEPLLEDPDNEFTGINDYKFMCFNGRAEFVVLDVDRAVGHRRNIYTRDWLDAEVLTDVPAIKHVVEAPRNLAEMIEVAEVLSQGFPFVRVDLYSVPGRIVFGEMTFFPWGGYIDFIPDTFDFDLGRKWTA